MLELLQNGRLSRFVALKRRFFIGGWSGGGHTGGQGMVVPGNSSRWMMRLSRLFSEGFVMIRGRSVLRSGWGDIMMIPVNSSRWVVRSSCLFLEVCVMIPVRVVLRSG